MMARAGRAPPSCTLAPRAAPGSASAASLRGVLLCGRVERLEWMGVDALLRAG
jgi:hypothetical protein